MAAIDYKTILTEISRFFLLNYYSNKSEQNKDIRDYDMTGKPATGDSCYSGIVATVDGQQCTSRNENLDAICE